jgi:CrcB protein
MHQLLLVCLGGAFGAGLRHLVSVGMARLMGPAFPWGTLFVNIAGSFAMGLLVVLLARKLPMPHEIRLFAATGVLGGFTTFSSFSLDVAALWENGAAGAAAVYVAASVAGSILAIFAGLWLARSLF